MTNQIVIVGSGAAGLMAALFAAEHSRSVLVLERTADGGRKILISGGGRCNVLPHVLAPERFVTASSVPLMRRMLRSWPLAQQRAFFEDTLQIPLKLEADTGKLFPVSDRARDVRDRLVAEARRRGVQFRFNTTVTALARDGENWTLSTSGGPLQASRVILATGGLSVPATGSDGGGLRIAESLGHRVHPLYPALTPLLAAPPVHAALSGLSLPVRIRARAHAGDRATEAHGGFLFTHRGYSGPAVLDISHVAVRARAAGEAATLRVQWAPLDADAWTTAFNGPAATVQGIVAAHLPQRLAAQLIDEAGIPPERRTPALRRDERIALIERLTAYVLPWTGDEGFKKAEVTGGGVALEDVDPRTLESRHQPGLYLCGEMLDAFGPIGGHNFAWAWATGRLAGRAAGV